MGTILALLGLCVLFSPIFLISLENEYRISARLPRVIPLIRILFLNPYKEFKKIASKSCYSKYYKFHYSPNTTQQKEWYQRQIEWGLSKRIGQRNTLVIANRILEFRIWLSLRSCENYDQLRYKAILLMMKISDEGFVFVSSPLYSHPKGIGGGIQELRKTIIDTAEDHHGFVFNQIPFLDFKLPYLKENKGRNKFDLFYGPVIASRPISKLVMNQNWETSLGCRTEHEVARKYSKPIEYK